MKLLDCKLGDRVCLDDGRLVELAWPQWPYTTPVKRKVIGKADPDTWFVRTITDGDFGIETRSDPYPLAVDLACSMVRRAPHFGVDAHDGRGDALDPIALGTAATFDRRGQGSL